MKHHDLITSEIIVIEGEEIMSKALKILSTKEKKISQTKECTYQATRNKQKSKQMGQKKRNSV